MIDFSKLRRLAEQATPHTVSRLNYKDGQTILSLLDERDHWHQQFIVNRDLAVAAERRVAALEEDRNAPPCTVCGAPSSEASDE